MILLIAAFAGGVCFGLLLAGILTSGKRGDRIGRKLNRNGWY